METFHRGEIPLVVGKFESVLFWSRRLKVKMQGSSDSEDDPGPCKIPRLANRFRGDRVTDGRSILRPARREKSENIVNKLANREVSLELISKDDRLTTEFPLHSISANSTVA